MRNSTTVLRNSTTAGLRNSTGGWLAMVVQGRTGVVLTEADIDRPLDQRVRVSCWSGDEHRSKRKKREIN